MTEGQPSSDDFGGRDMPSGRPQTHLSFAAGRVMTVDPKTGEIAIEHRPIRHLDMESRILISRVAGHLMLEGLMRGDKIRSEVEGDSKSYVITWIENGN